MKKYNPLENGYKRFEKVLKLFGIPFTPFDGDLGKEIDEILARLFPVKVL